MEKINKGEGFVIRVQGAVVDVRFNNETPEVYEALNITMKNGPNLFWKLCFKWTISK